jgi:hypothetical protein
MSKLKIRNNRASDTVPVSHQDSAINRLLSYGEWKYRPSFLLIVVNDWRIGLIDDEQYGFIGGPNRSGHQTSALMYSCDILL